MGPKKPEGQKSTLPPGTKATGVPLTWGKLTGGASPLGGQGGKKSGSHGGKKSGGY